MKKYSYINYYRSKRTIPQTIPTIAMNEIIDFNKIYIRGGQVFDSALWKGVWQNWEVDKESKA